MVGHGNEIDTGPEEYLGSPLFLCQRSRIFFVKIVRRFPRLERQRLQSFSDPLDASLFCKRSFHSFLRGKAKAITHFRKTEIGIILSQQRSELSAGGEHAIG